MESKDDEDISIDFGKIKNFFKSITAGNTEESSIGGKKDSEDIPINWSKLAEFFKTYGILLLILIPIAVNFIEINPTLYFLFYYIRHSY